MRRLLCALLLVLGVQSPAGADSESGQRAMDQGDFEGAMALWREPAATGDARAQFGLGRLLLLRGDPEGLRLIRASAQAGYLPGEYELARFHALGLYTPMDSAQARGWYERAAAHGHGDTVSHPLEASEARLRVLVTEKGRVSPTPANLTLLRSVADAGHAAGQLYYATTLLAKDGVLQKGQEGWRRAPSLVEAHAYFVLSARQGQDVRWLFFGPGDLASMAHEVMSATQRDQSSARVRTWLDDQAAGKHGWLYEQHKQPQPAGKRMLDDLAEAERAIWSLRQGEPTVAGTDLEHCHLVRRVVAEWPEPDAVRWVEHWTVEGGGATELFHLTFDRSGNELSWEIRRAPPTETESPPDPAEAQTAYERGDFERARAIWDALARRGSRVAELSLGNLHEQGQGVALDLPEAHKWYVLAAKLGSTEAHRRAVELGSRMTAAQLEESARRVKAWMDPPGPDAEVLEPLFPILREGKLGYVSGSGRVVVPPHFDAMDPLWASEASGRDIVESIRYMARHGIRDELVEVQRGGWWYFVDRSGRVVTQRYEEVGRFRDGRAPVRLGGKWRYVNRVGIPVIGLGFDDADSFQAGAARVHVGERWGLLGPRGDYIVEPRFTYPKTGCGSIFADGLFKVCQGEKQGILRADGRWAVEPRFDAVHRVLEGLANVEDGGKGGYVDVETGQVLIPLQFDSAAPFSGGYARVTLRGREGIVDRRGRFVAVPELERRGKQLHGSKIAFQQGGKWGVLDAFTRAILLEPRFDSIGWVEEGRAVVSMGEAFGYIDAAGGLVVKPKFSSAERFSDGLGRVAVRSGSNREHVYGYIDRTGAWAIEPRFAEATKFKEGVALVIPMGETGVSYIDREGNTVHAFSP